MGVFPKNALYSLAALIVFYKGSRNGEVIKLSDNPEFLELHQQYEDELFRKLGYDPVTKTFVKGGK